VTFIAGDSEALEAYIALKQTVRGLKKFLEHERRLFSEVGCSLGVLKEFYEDVRQFRQNINTFRRAKKVDSVPTVVEPQPYNFAVEVLELDDRISAMMAWISQNAPKDVNVKPVVAWRSGEPIDFEMTPEELQGLVETIDKVLEHIA